MTLFPSQNNFFSVKFLRDFIFAKQDRVTKITCALKWQKQGCSDLPNNLAF